MKVLLVSNSLKCGGKEKQIYFLLQYLNKSNIKTALLLRKNEVNFDLQNISATKIFYCDKLSYKNFITTYLKVVKEFKPNIVHTWEGMVTFLCLLFNFIVNKKIINGEIRFARPAKKYSLERLQQIFNTNLSSINIANTSSGLQSFKLSANKKNLVVNNGYDFDESSEVKFANNNASITICKIANFTKPKDYSTLILACINLMSQGYRIKCKFIGDGPELNEMKKLVPIDKKSYFSFLGNRDEVFEQLLDADICILLSKKGSSEGMSNAIMEYMIAGKPVIATNTGGNPELIQNEYNGFLIMHEDKNALSFYLKKLIEDKELRKLMGERSRKIAVENFSIKKMADAYINVYKNLIAG